MKSSHLRVVADDLLGHNARVYYVARDGTEMEISDIVTGLELNVKLGAGEMNTATLETIAVKVDVRAVAEEIDRALARAFVSRAQCNAKVNAE